MAPRTEIRIVADQPKKPRGLTPEQWAEARTAFEAGASEAELAKRYGVDRKTIRARKRAECWTPQVTPHVGKGEADAARERATAKVIDIATKRAVEQLEDSGAVRKVSEHLAASLELHASIASRLMEAADDLLDSFANDKDGELASTREGSGRDVIIRQGRAEVFQQLVAGVKAAVTLSRDIAGLRIGQPSVGETKGGDDTFTFKVDPEALEAAQQLQAG